MLTGAVAENGSGGWLGDITISGGEYGILAGSQQYSASRISITDSQKCIGLIWNWVWVRTTTSFQQRQH